MYHLEIVTCFLMFFVLAEEQIVHFLFTKCQCMLSTHMYKEVLVVNMHRNTATSIQEQNYKTFFLKNWEYSHTLVNQKEWVSKVIARVGREFNSSLSPQWKLWCDHYKMEHYDLSLSMTATESISYRDCILLPLSSCQCSLWEWNLLGQIIMWDIKSIKRKNTKKLNL